mmetsp:Transcript_17553/g.22773  ORF Transcript_17553/g.22773 Transcript_17553/m.22773 type:complete len:572 (-) Transcript_17553:64-1779(-)|eukprot:CAMPEP_0117802718 /NCGR_PEP_ID=MMETSP0948-20121206/15925_1 /TAXON_ID=44440 /ORGANISM="Chattonella subsalsa, Strain CCMP2191" /LENGTH=571 /DNA_ID=CAMNT_0005635627 /DNA_START=152 /DNA_END=1867 /DNA_ORIENTATION=-
MKKCSGFSSKLLLVFILTKLLEFLANPSNSHHTTIGFGAQRLSSFRGYNYHGLFDSLCLKSEQVEEHYFEDAILDHFSPTEFQGKWASPQRYFVNKEFWGRKDEDKSKAVFLYIGGEGPESKARLTSKSYMYSLAEKHNALMVDIEHRYYGKSFPTKDMSSSNLQYLTSAQALADLALLLERILEEYEAKDATVVAFGGSYPGNLAAWARLKYPHLIHGSIASSAPLTAQLDFQAYMEVVGSSLKYFGGEECYNSVKKGADILMEKLEGDEQADLLKDLKTCEDNITNSKDKWVLLSNVMGNFQGTVQYNLEKEGAITVKDICNTLADGTDAYEQFIQVQDLYLKQNNETCLEVSWTDMLKEMTNITFDGQKAGRQWTYQTCNEFGYFQTATSPHQPFNAFSPYLDINSFIFLCGEAFDLKLPPGIEWTNFYYGGTDIDEENILFVNGNIDPWHALGLYSEDQNEDTDILYIDGTAHCADMHASASGDPENLIKARKEISEKVNIWVNSESSSNNKEHERQSVKMNKVAFAFTLIATFLCGGFVMVMTLIIWKRKKSYHVKSLIQEGYSEI